MPSSNTALEPITTAICASLPVDEYNVTVHFSRFPVTTIALSSSALSQFDVEKILPAARLLADAGVDVIGWSGTSAGECVYISYNDKLESVHFPLVS